jgi:hypothetical protein
MAAKAYFSYVIQHLQLSLDLALPRPLRGAYLQERICDSERVNLSIFEKVSALGFSWNGYHL